MTARIAHTPAKKTLLIVRGKLVNTCRDGYRSLNLDTPTFCADAVTVISIAFGSGRKLDLYLCSLVRGPLRLTALNFVIMKTHFP